MHKYTCLFIHAYTYKKGDFSPFSQYLYHSPICMACLLVSMNPADCFGYLFICLQGLPFDCFQQVALKIAHSWRAFMAVCLYLLIDGFCFNGCADSQGFIHDFNPPYFSMIKNWQTDTTITPTTVHAVKKLFVLIKAPIKPIMAIKRAKNAKKVAMREIA